MRKRTRSREFALQMLYQMDIAQEAGESKPIPFETDSVETELDEPEVREYADRLSQGTLGQLSKIDAIIEKYAENWEMNRMACVDRNILRLATYEILFVEDIPMKVAINEAVELAKRYGEADSSKFVNGILDRIAKTECKP